MLFRPLLRSVVVLLAVVTAGVPALAAAAGPTLDRIQKSGTLRLAYRESANPFSFKDRDGKVRGYSVELCEQVAKSIQAMLALPALELEWRPVDAADRLDVVASGRADIECGTTTITLTRMEKVDFSVPIFVDGGGVLVRGDGAKPVFLADLKGTRIAVIGGTTTEQALARTLKVIEAPATLVQVKDGAEGIALVAAGKANGYAGDRVVLAGFKVRDPRARDLVFVENDFSFEPYALVVRRDDPDFRLAVNRALVNLYKSGGVDPIFLRWLSSLGRPGPLLHSMFYLNSLPD
jgi:glutamate/aspartate transport system substrate-binding protein